MAVLLNRPYGGLAAGAITAFPPSTEASLIAQGIAANSVAATSTGAYTTGEFAGRCSIAAAGTSVVITNPNVNAQTKIFAAINQAAIDTTLTFVGRVVPAAGSFTLFGNAAATAAVTIDWAIISCGEAPIQ